MDKKRILVVDDEPDIVAMLKTRLEHNNYDVIVAYDGDVALERIQKNKPDLILLDVMLPNQSGYKICETIKEDESLSDIPVIMLTALDDEIDQELGTFLGANAYMTKPFDPQELIAKIDKLLTSKNDH